MGFEGPIGQDSSWLHIPWTLSYSSCGLAVCLQDSATLETGALKQYKTKRIRELGSFVGYAAMPCYASPSKFGLVIKCTKNEDMLDMTCSSLAMFVGALAQLLRVSWASSARRHRSQYPQAKTQLDHNGSNIKTSKRINEVKSCCGEITRSVTHIIFAVSWTSRRFAFQIRDRRFDNKSMRIGVWRSSRQIYELYTSLSKWSAMTSKRSKFPDNFLLVCLKSSLLLWKRLKNRNE